MLGIRNAIAKNPQDLVAYSDFFQMNRLIADEEHGGNVKPTFDNIRWLRSELNKQIRSGGLGADLIIEMSELLKKTYLYMAKVDFDSYMTYLEWNRKPAEKFYQPRRKIMYQLATAIQRLLDGELDELFLSMPPRVGKTTFLMFLMTMLIGVDSERSNLYSAFSDTITKAFYQGVLEIINDSTTYLWKDIFPEAKIVGTNSQEETINIDRRKRYPSLTCRSLYGTLNGACDCNGFLVSDDLIGGIEEALNKDRLYSAWSKVDNNLIPRAKETAKLLWCGTRWSQIDPAGLRMAALQGDRRFDGRRYEIINLPALNEAGESNFDYPYNVGFSTTYYLQRKASFEKNGDLPSWDAQYMGRPIERGSVLFEMNDFTYFNGELPDENDIIRKFMVIDPAYGGGDFTAGPVCYQTADGLVYVVDVIYSNGDKKLTQPMIVQKIKKWGVKACQFECTKATAAYMEKVEEMLKADGIKCNLTYRPAPTVGASAAKQVRIFDCAPEIKDRFRFLEGKYRDKYYEQFMTNVFSFSLTGNNKHDDAPDSLAQAVKFTELGSSNIKIVKRIF